MINFEPMRELELIIKLETFYDINVILIIRDLQIFLPNNLSNFKQNFILQLHDTKEQKKILYILSKKFSSRYSQRRSVAY